MRRTIIASVVAIVAVVAVLTRDSSTPLIKSSPPEGTSRETAPETSVDLAQVRNALDSVLSRLEIVESQLSHLGDRVEALARQQSSPREDEVEHGDPRQPWIEWEDGVIIAGEADGVFVRVEVPDGVGPISDVDRQQLERIAKLELERFQKMQDFVIEAVEEGRAHVFDTATECSDFAKNLRPYTARFRVDGKSAVVDTYSISARPDFSKIGEELYRINEEFKARWGGERPTVLQPGLAELHLVGN